MPLNRRSILLLSSTGTNMNLTGDAVKGDSWYGYADGLHTIQAVYAAFEGRLHIQATLELEPAESDWFDISATSTGTAFTTSGTDIYVDFPDGSEITGSEAYTFQGNYTWIRLYVDRTHLAGNNDLLEYGQITKAILSA